MYCWKIQWPMVHSALSSLLFKFLGLSSLQLIATVGKVCWTNVSSSPVWPVFVYLISKTLCHYFKTDFSRLWKFSISNTLFRHFVLLTDSARQHQLILVIYRYSVWGALSWGPSNVKPTGTKVQASKRHGRKKQWKSKGGTRKGKGMFKAVMLIKDMPMEGRKGIKEEKTHRYRVCVVCV